MMMLRATKTLVLALTVCVVTTPLLAAGNPALKGYHSYKAYLQAIEKIATSKHASLTKLTDTAGKRAVHVLTIGHDKPDEKPAILIVGSAHASHLTGSELAVRIARQLAVDNNEAISKLLDQTTFYIIPRPNPDGSEKNFQRPFREQEGNSQATDDDRDGMQGEDPPNDLNGDGWITVMRVEDTAGKYRAHPDDPRVLIEVDRKKNEQGQYRLISEGRDDDHDEKFNEDAGDGVSVNRNFTFRYPYFSQGAGEQQASEPETKAVIDFAFDHPNIALVFTFTPEDNLFHPWKPNQDKGRIKTGIHGGDAPYQNLIAERYKKAHGGKDPIAAGKPQGAISEWAYFHYGRWSLAARGWWIPKTAAPKKKEGEEKKEEKKPSGEKRGADDINKLRWLDKQKIKGFVNWTEIKHPDFPNAKVEIGGFKPFYQLNPPAKQLNELAKKHTEFLTNLVELFPRLTIENVRSKPLGGDIYRVTAEVVNHGYFPTMSEMGKTSRQHYPLQAELKLPIETTFIQGSPRRQLPRIEGSGAKVEQTWLFRLPKGAATKTTLRVWAPTIGSIETKVNLKP